jgi:hypothetical protein
MENFKGAVVCHCLREIIYYGRPAKGLKRQKTLARGCQDVMKSFVTSLSILTQSMDKQSSNVGKNGSKRYSSGFLL